MPNPHAATPQEMFELIAGKHTDDPSWFTFGSHTLTSEDIISLLRDRVSEARWRLFEQTLTERTDNVSVIVEGMVDLGNVGAVIRSADGFGVQSVHSIDTADAYKRSKRTSQGADKWIDRTRWQSTQSCIDALTNDGFTVVAMSPSSHATPLNQMDMTGRIALAFGNELEGLSAELLSLADDTATVPMSGFAASFNISVAAAVALYEVRRQRIERFGSNGDLDAERRNQICAVWLMKSVRESRRIVERCVADGYR